MRTAALLTIAALSAGALLAAPLPPEAGKPLYERHCLLCHGEKGQGDGKAAVYLYPKPRDFTRGLFKIRTTPTGSLPTDRDLFDTLGRGMAGTAMPAFSQLEDQERWALVAYLKTLVEAYEYRQPEPPVTVGPAPPKTSKTLALGQQVYRKMECFKCHGEGGRGDGPSAAELTDDWEIPIRVRDFTDGTYKGGPSDRDLYLRFTTGMTGSPMPAYSDDKMSPAERWALVHYVQSLRRRDRPAITPPRDGLVVAARVASEPPLDPFDAAWKQALGAEIPMNPLWHRPESLSSVMLRALHGPKQIAFLLEWRDASLEAGSDRTEAFRDAAAIQFGLDQALTFVGMGHPQGPTNIWHWKSDWQAKLALEVAYPARHVDFLPFGEGLRAGREAGNAFSAAAHASPVEDLAAIGFGTLEPRADQAVEGQGLWSDGAWHVVLRRSLKSAGKGSVEFAPGATVPFALACWDGAQADRDGQKVVSTWHRLRLGAPGPAARGR